jgi:hypothetical protein
MIIIHDSRIPSGALKKLADFGETVEIHTDEITYPSTSGHPDIFFCQMETELIVALNLPEKYKSVLSKNLIPFATGESAIGNKYPDTAKYNAVCTEKYLIHNFRHTDSSITNRAGNRELIHVDQGYTRCNLLPLHSDHFITSDAGIARVLGRYGLDHLYVNPSEILLPGMKHGFFGGASGIYQNKVFILGSLNKFSEGEKVRSYLEWLRYEIIELYDGPLFDGGSLFFF